MECGNSILVRTQPRHRSVRIFWGQLHLGSSYGHHRRAIDDECCVVWHQQHVGVDVELVRGEWESNRRWDVQNSHDTYDAESTLQFCAGEGCSVSDKYSLLLKSDNPATNWRVVV